MDKEIVQVCSIYRYPIYQRILIGHTFHRKKRNSASRIYRSSGATGTPGAQEDSRTAKPVYKGSVCAGAHYPEHATAI